MTIEWAELAASLLRAKLAARSSNAFATQDVWEIFVDEQTRQEWMGRKMMIETL